MTSKANRDEESRLVELNSLGILDSPEEERYDRFTRLARRTFNVPLASFSLVDDFREWFKSRHGYETTEIPLQDSLSVHAIYKDTPLVVHDATRDVRFSRRLGTGTHHPVLSFQFPAHLRLALLGNRVVPDNHA